MVLLHHFPGKLDGIVPPGVKLIDANRILSSDHFFTYREGGSPSAFANIFRYAVLRELGGWWIDTDVVLLDKTLPEEDEIWFARQDDDIINCAVMYARQDHPVMARCFDEARSAGKDVSWGQTGPLLFTRVLNELELSIRSAPKHAAYPTEWRNALDILIPEKTLEVEQLTKGSTFLHLWNEVLRRENVNKFEMPLQGTFLRQLAEQFPVPGWTFRPQS